MYNSYLVSVVKSGTSFIKSTKFPKIDSDTIQNVNINQDQNSDIINNTNNNTNKVQISKSKTKTDQNSDLLPDNNQNTVSKGNYNTDEALEITIKKNQKNRGNRTGGIPITQNKLQEAVIWSEILGKPLCKRGKRR